MNHTFCEHCGTKIIEDKAQFCQSCGKATSTNTQVEPSSTKGVNSQEGKSKAIIKCGNCGYVGMGEPARSIGAMILAWLCVLFAPLITIIYFIATNKYRCPKCKSTFLGVKNKEGVFTGQGAGVKSPIMIIIWILLGIVLIGILSSAVLVSLSTAREKAKQSQEQRY